MSIDLTLGPAVVRFTGRAEGDLGHAGATISTVSPEVAARRRAVLDRPWTWLRQVHGDEVVVVRGPADRAGERADASVSADRTATLAILVADCAPVALASPEGLIGAVHAGWRGVRAGMVERAVATMRMLGASRVDAALGPCIHAGCYEFDPESLDALAAELGEGVRGRTSSGRPALDLRAAVVQALERAGVAELEDVDVCTACSSAHFSFRARGEAQRQAMLVWRP